jgi:hypothetical protein
MIRAALLGLAIALVQTAEVQAEYFPQGACNVRPMAGRSCNAL